MCWLEMKQIPIIKVVIFLLYPLLIALMTGETTAAQTPSRTITVASPISTFPATVSLMENHVPARLIDKVKYSHGKL